MKKGSPDSCTEALKLQSNNYFKMYLSYNHFATPSKMGNVLCIYARSFYKTRGKVLVLVL